MCHLPCFSIHGRRPHCHRRCTEHRLRCTIKMSQLIRIGTVCETFQLTQQRYCRVQVAFRFLRGHQRNIRTRGTKSHGKMPHIVSKRRGKTRVYRILRERRVLSRSKRVIQRYDTRVFQRVFKILIYKACTRGHTNQGLRRNHGGGGWLGRRFCVFPCVAVARRAGIGRRDFISTQMTNVTLDTDRKWL